MSNAVKATASDKIVLTSLNPMSELDLSVPVMLFDSAMQMTYGIFFDAEHIITDAGKIKSSIFIGWRHAPVFKPEWVEK